MGRKNDKPVTAKTGGPFDEVRRRGSDGKVDTVSPENHMQVAARLSRVTNMHGTPQPRRGSGK